MSRPTIERPARGWSQELINMFWEIWDRWHLNDMRTECEHQRSRGETYKTHPNVECPDCNYRLGSAWLTEQVPDQVLEFLRSLPDTDRTPAWV